MVNLIFGIVYILNFLFNIVFVVFYLLIVFVGLVGNGLVIIIVYKSRLMFFIINILFVNVVVVDFVLLVWCFIFLVVNLLGKYVFGKVVDFICKFFIGYFVMCVIVGVIYFSFVVLVLEWYYVIVKLFKLVFVFLK